MPPATGPELGRTARSSGPKGKGSWAADRDWSVEVVFVDMTVPPTTGGPLRSAQGLAEIDGRLPSCPTRGQG
ncbi:hypothetical protein GCM10010207_66580 [Streptomyces atratus]|nr:hypothetical protein GCM10010207_66580 [Streptomyces atratus]